MSDTNPDAAALQAKMLKVCDLQLDNMLRAAQERAAQTRLDPWKLVFWSLAAGFAWGFALGCGAALSFTTPIEWFAFVILPVVVGILGCVAVWAGRRFIP